jgi:hypothetical protein
MKLSGESPDNMQQQQPTITAKSKEKINCMKQYFSLKGLSSAFNLIWKIWLVLNLAWIGQSLHVIATNVQFRDLSQDEFDPVQKEGWTNSYQPQICPKSGPVT